MWRGGSPRIVLIGYKIFSRVIKTQEGEKIEITSAVFINTD